MPALFAIDHDHIHNHLLEHHHHHHCDADQHESDVHHLLEQPNGLRIVIEQFGHVHSLIHDQRDACAGAALHPALTLIASPKRRPRPLMATIAYAHDANALAGTPGSPPDLTNSKSSKSSSIRSSSTSDLIMGPGDLSHFEDINLDDIQGPVTFPMPLSPSHRVLFDSRKPGSHGRTATLPHPSHHSFRDLTGAAKPRHLQLGAASHHGSNGTRLQLQLHAPPRSPRRGFTSPSAPSLHSISSLTAAVRRSRSPSPNPSHSFTSAPRTLSRKNSRNLEVSPSSSVRSRRQSWQSTTRKTVKEREAECDDEDDELPEDAVIWNVPISPRPAQDRSPAPSVFGSPPASESVPSPASSRPTSQPSDKVPSTGTSPVPSTRRVSPQSLSPSFDNPGNVVPHGLARQRTHTWNDTYSALDQDAKKLTEALEVYQTQIDQREEVRLQQPNAARPASLDQTEPRAKAASLPPLRRSDPLIDPLQPSMEKTKYLSRTRPSWLPPKNPKEEKKHLKEYQRMLARIEEAERLDAQRQEQEAAARETAERIKAEYWSTLLLPKWATEMANPELRAKHRKMWWNGVPPKLRGDVWRRGVGNELGITESTYRVALSKAQAQVKALGDDALDGQYRALADMTRDVFPELKMFAPATSPFPPTGDTTTMTTTSSMPEQPLHADLLDLLLAYSLYRPDVRLSMTETPHLAALLLLNLPSPACAFALLANLLNRSLPLSFLLNDHAATHSIYASTLTLLDKKIPILARRLADLRIEPSLYLRGWFEAGLAGRLDLESACRVMDVWSVEGDAVLPRVAVGVLAGCEGVCLGGGEADVLHVLKGRERKSVSASELDDVGKSRAGGGLKEVDGFMGRVWDVGRR